MSAKLAKSKKYPNLHRDQTSGIFIFRKYSSLKGKEFNRSTGERDNEARAYRIGLEAFNEWLGKITDESGVVYFGRYAKRYLNQKLENPKLSANTKRVFKNQFESSSESSGRDEAYRPRLLDAFGHLPIERITSEVWMRWVNEILASRGSYKFFNARKSLLEVLRAAHEEGYIERVPRLENPDGAAAPPRELSPAEIRLLFKSAHYKNTGLAPRVRNWIKLLMFIMWKQGARPGEILQYRWDMIHWSDGTILIPGEITKTRRSRTILLNRSVLRVLRVLKGTQASSPFLFPSGGDPARSMGDYMPAWRGVCRRAKFEAQIYWFRDSFVSRKLREGNNAIFVAQYIDSSATMLAQKYAVASQETQKKVAE